MTRCRPLLLVSLLCLAPAAVAAPLLHEIRTGQVAADVDEYFELSGDPGESLSGYWYLVIGDGEQGSGVLEVALNLSGHAIGADGFFSVGEDASVPCGEIDAVLPEALNFEDSDNVTHLLVNGFIGALGADLDTDDDGVLDAEPWLQTVDCLALIETPLSGDEVYCDTQLGPDGPFVPVHVLRCTTGWGFGDIVVCEYDTPGGANTTACQVPNTHLSWGALKSGYR
ncbi:hypothetical protein H8E07_08095 [bacterium]|nr:hypothetical protein [bacterium]